MSYKIISNNKILVDKVVVGTPIRTIYEDPGLFSELSDVNVELRSEGGIIYYDSASATWTFSDNIIISDSDTTVNSNLKINSNLVTLSNGSVDSASYDGAGVIVDGAGASITYGATNNDWNFNRSLNVSGDITAVTYYGDGSQLEGIIDSSGVLGLINFRTPQIIELNVDSAYIQARIPQVSSFEDISVPLITDLEYIENNSINLRNISGTYIKNIPEITVDTTIGRNLFDLNNNQLFDITDVNLWIDYTNGDLTSGATYDYIVNVVKPYILANPTEYAAFISGGVVDDVAVANALIALYGSGETTQEQSNFFFPRISAIDSGSSVTLTQAGNTRLQTTGEGVDITGNLDVSGNISGTAASFSSITTTDGVVIGGDLQVNGTTVTVNSVNLDVTDNMIYMNAGESDGSPIAFIDVGFAANVNEDGSYGHTGLFRDASDSGTWKLFDNYLPEPDASVQIDTSHPSFAFANLQVNNLIANTFIGDGSQLTGMYSNSDVIALVDSAYVQARQSPGTDSAAVIGVINFTVDSAYVQARQDAGLDNAIDSGTGITVTGDLTVDSDLFVAGIATINGIDIGTDDSVTGVGNTSLGGGALGNLTAGSYNTAFGYGAANNVTTGSNNIAIGYNAQLSDSAANNELVIGDEFLNRMRIPGLGIDTDSAGQGRVLAWDSATRQFYWSGSITVDDINGFVFGEADSVTGTNNTAFGADAFSSLTSGSNNTAFGGQAGTSLTIGSNNLLLGAYADVVDSASNGEIVIGNDSSSRLRIPGLGLDTNDAADGQSLTWDSATGQFVWGASGSVDSAATIALITTTVDSAYVQARQTAGTDSAAVTSLITTTVDSAYVQARQANLQNIYDSATGTSTTGDLYVNSDLTVSGTINDVTLTTASSDVSAIRNVAVGVNVLSNLTTGSKNTVVGFSTGSTVTSGSNNIIIGDSANVSSATASNEIVLGNNLNNRLRIPGLSLDTNSATNGQVLAWNDGFQWTTVNGVELNTLDSAQVISLLDSVGVNNVIPAADSAYDLGSPTRRWRDLYLSGNTIYLGDSAVISASGTTILFNSQPIGGGSVDSAATVTLITTTVDSAYVAARVTTSANSRDSANDVVFTGSVVVDSDLTVTGSINNITIGDGNLTDSAINNIGYGIDILTGLTTGSNNTVYGYNAANTLTTGGNNIVIGNGADVSAADVSNEIVIGASTNDRLRIPGLGFDTNDATDGQALTWDSTAGQFAWSTISGGGIDSAAVIALVDSAYVQARQIVGGGGLDSAGVVSVLNNASVGEFVNTHITTTVTVMGDGVANIDNRPDAIPAFTTAFGASALNALGSGGDNTAVGRFAAGSVTTGARNNAFGRDAMYQTTTSTSDVVAIGTSSLYATTGNQNTAVGNSSGFSTGTSKNSVFVGYQAGYDQAATGTNGTNNIVIGHTASRSSAAVNNEITLGNASIDRLRIPGLGFDTNDATDGQSLTWDSATGNLTWATITGGGGTFADGTESLPSITFSSDSDTGFYRIGANSFGVTVGGQRYTYWDGTYTYFNNVSTGHARMNKNLLTLEFNTNTFQDVACLFQFNGTQAGAITINTDNTTSYGVSSDYRLKENVVMLDSALDRINSIPVRRFNMINGSGRTVDGFLAHELQSVVPEAVVGEKDEVDADGNPKYQLVDQSKLVPLLVAAVQELSARVEQLEAQLGV